MFKSYNTSNTLYSTIGDRLVFDIIDTEFCDEIVVDNDWNQFIKAFIELYQRRGLTVAANIALLIIHIRDISGTSANLTNLYNSSSFAPYKDEVSKYLILL